MTPKGSKITTTTGSAASRAGARRRIAAAGLLAAAVALVFLFIGDGDDDVRRETTPSITDGRTVRLERVVDGDTLLLEDGDRVRLIGINAPEIQHGDAQGECFGRRATEFAEDLLAPGEELRLVRDVEARDQYDRLLAYVYRASDGLFVNAELVRRGYAYIETVPPNVEHAARFKRLAAQARERGTGLWSECPNEDGRARSVAGGCLADYQGGCVPPPPPDLDCADLDGPITVVGDDPHRLDLDGDRRACEPKSVR